MHRYGLALLIVASPLSAFAAELPKEGTYDFNSCWSGVNNTITFSKTHTASSLPREAPGSAGEAAEV